MSNALLASKSRSRPGISELSGLFRLAFDDPYKDYFAYQFRTPMPIDVSKIDGDMWPSYERCENLSCHAAELRTVTLIFCSNFGPPILSDNKKLSIRS